MSQQKSDFDNEDTGGWDDMFFEDMTDNTKMKDWEIELYNKFTSATIEKDKYIATKLFFEVIDLEKANTNIINRRFYSMKQILILKSETSINNNTEISNHFEQLLKYYDPNKPTYDISTSDFNNTLRSLFTSLKAHNNGKTLLKLAKIAYKYFENMKTDTTDEFTQNTVQFTLDLLQNEYISRIDVEYIPKICLCDQYDIFNAINDYDNKIVIDFGTYEQFYKLHMNGATNIDISKNIDDKIVFDVLWKHIKMRQRAEIYFYYQCRDIVEESKSNNNIMNMLERVQQLVWQETMKITPFYIYKDDLNIFHNKYYPFLCEEGLKDRYKGCDKQMYIDYPNMIINNKLFLGNINHVTNDEILKDLKITHIVNCTPYDYDNYITKSNNDSYIQISINDHYYEEIDQHFETTFKFIDNALQNDEKNKVCVHCQAGISRSATIVIAFLMTKNDMTLDTAMQFVKSKRSKIQPNGGFMERLQKYDKILQEKRVALTNELHMKSFMMNI
eukprot:534154_1